MLSHHRIAVIVSRFNEEITSRLREGAMEALARHGISADQILLFEVPGAYEIPLLAQRVLAKPEVVGVIALGAIIRGETPHFDIVASQSARGLMDVMLASQKPIINGILTTDTDAQAWDRVGGAHGHKGADAADVLLHMISLLSEV
jgi:6,7-dimethyl-8-ribityllumazine synthase